MKMMVLRVLPLAPSQLPLMEQKVYLQSTLTTMVISMSYPSQNDNKIAWYENNGSESFTARTITTSANGATAVFATDVDSDGDIDVLSASLNDDKIAWYENDGSESFTANDITTSADFAMSVFAIDVDNDGDIDVLSASLLDDKIAWYKNNGSQTFTARTITITTSTAACILFLLSM